MARSSKAPEAAGKLTPMMQQYRRVKSQIPADALLLFRLGDFYEMFFDDAKSGAELLNLTLTNRNGIPMCGIPHHAAEGYISKLLKQGRKVALCDQLEEAKPGQLVDRDVTQILSPGTHFDPQILDGRQNNFIAAVYPSGKLYGFALIDLTTGDFRIAELTSIEQLNNELARTRPTEVIVPAEWPAEAQSKIANPKSKITPHDGWTFEPETAFFTLRDHFKTQSLDGFGAGDLTAGIGAAGAALHYLQQSLRRNTSHIHRLSVYQVGDYLAIDAATQRNLELIESQRGDQHHTLINCMDRSRTPMGARLLREWVTHPLKNVTAIKRRQQVIVTFCDEPHVLAAFRDALQNVRDMERTLARLCVGGGNCRDLISLKDSLAALPTLKSALQPLTTIMTPDRGRGCQSGEHQQRVPVDPFSDRSATAAAGPVPLMVELVNQILELPDVVALIDAAIVNDPPLGLKEGGLIKLGHDDQLDQFRRGSTEGKEWIAALQQQEIERTGIGSLKVRFNQVFGYYIEITRSHLDKVPAEYTRKQTIVNGERYVTPELKEMEGKILGADEKAHALEYQLFQKIRESVAAHSRAVQQSAAAIAALDALAGLAELARHHNYCRPEVTDGDRIDIVDGRHPVLEQTLVEERFVPNDTLLDNKDNQILIITGPNMAGKSTYIRQVALLVLMAQTGSFVPAKKATMGLVDRIFTRIGAADDLSRGQSTFMVEMNETASILNNATNRSLVILDEIGRGTSTFDGLSIAWAVAEYLHTVSGAKTLFATHYHELTELAVTQPRVKNYNVAVREWHDQVIFLHKILPGSTDKSYGIQVARLAGLPKDVIARAKEVLNNLEESELSAEGQPKIAKSGSKKPMSATRKHLKELPPQMFLFGQTP